MLVIGRDRMKRGGGAPRTTAQREGESKSDNSEYGPAAAYVALPDACWIARYRPLQAHGAKGCHRQARQLETWGSQFIAADARRTRR